MPRLTRWNGKKWILPQGAWREITDRLAAYENTGLEPGEVVTLQAASSSPQVIQQEERYMLESEPHVEKINLSRKEAAAMLGVSLPTLQRLTHMCGGVPHFHVGRKVLYPRQGLIEWAARQGEARSVL